MGYSKLSFDHDTVEIDASWVLWTNLCSAREDHKKGSLNHEATSTDGLAHSVASPPHYPRGSCRHNLSLSRAGIERGVGGRFPAEQRSNRSETGRSHDDLVVWIRDARSGFDDG
jgi:hypothetical protein